MTVKFFGGLRQITGQSQLSVSGATLQQVLVNLSVAYPDLAEAIFSDETGRLRPHVRIIINGVDSELIEGLDTSVSDDDQIAIFPPIAGGER